MNEALLQELADKRALDELIHRQAMAIDLRQWDAYRACFEDDVHFDFREHTDRVIGKGFGVVHSSDVWVEQVKQAVSGFDATQHCVSNMLHSVSKDTAKSECYVVAEHFLNNDTGDRSISVGGIYRIESQRGEGGWKIKRWYLKILWYRGNPSLYQLSAQKGGEV